MTYQQYDSSTKHARLMRAEAGDYLKRLRLDSGLTQRELADRLNLQYYTFISQVENGQGRLPPKLWVKTARALNVSVKKFSLDMLAFYDPHAHMAITAEEELKEVISNA
jgi:transcriptional regulator with XRE-family HTH domain